MIHPTIVRNGSLADIRDPSEQLSSPASIRLAGYAVTISIHFGPISGTSVVMIERHYGHLVRDDAEQALARLAL